MYKDTTIEDHYLTIEYENKNNCKNKIVLLLEYSDTHPPTNSQLATQHVHGSKHYLVEIQYKLDQEYHSVKGSYACIY